MADAPPAVRFAAVMLTAIQTRAMPLDARGTALAATKYAAKWIRVASEPLPSAVLLWRLAVVAVFWPTKLHSAWHALQIVPIAQ